MWCVFTTAFVCAMRQLLCKKAAHLLAYSTDDLQWGRIEKGAKCDGGTSQFDDGLSWTGWRQHTVRRTQYYGLTHMNMPVFGDTYAGLAGIQLIILGERPLRRRFFLFCLFVFLKRRDRKSNTLVFLYVKKTN